LTTHQLPLLLGIRRAGKCIEDWSAGFFRRKIWNLWHRRGNGESPIHEKFWRFDCKWIREKRVWSRLLVCWCF